MAKDDFVLGFFCRLVIYCCFAMLYLERNRFTKKEGVAVKFSKRGKILLAIILVGGIGGLVLNSITGHGASNRSFIIPIVVALLIYVGFRGWEK